MEVFVSAWVGSSNLGDELVFKAMAAKLSRLGVDVTAASLSPATTVRMHGVAAVPSFHPTQLLGAVIRADRVVLGGGGLLQDETSNLNLPYHLWRPITGALLRKPVAGVGLGAGPLRTRAGRDLVRRALRRAKVITVRDRPSRELLATLGVDAELAADLAWSLAPGPVDLSDRLVVSLRPPVSSAAWRTAAQGVHMPDEKWVSAVAAALDRIATTTGLTSRFVALQSDRDSLVHDLVAERMESSSTSCTPDLDGLLSELGSGRLTVAMRYHAAIGSALSGRPVALIGYSPKMTALAADLGGGASIVSNDVSSIGSLPAAVEAVAGREEEIAESAALLRVRETANDEAIQRLLEDR